MADEDRKELNDSDIAIVGMAAHLPGARNFREFWENLKAGVESVRLFTDRELAQEGVAPQTLRRPDYVKWGAPLEDMEYFDAEFFGLSPKEAAIMDPQHRHFLECAWEALEDSGHTPSRFAGSIGVFAGCGMGAYFMFNLLTNPDLVASVGLFLLRHTGNDKDFLATRASYNFNLNGPSISIQTACSTALVAVHAGVQSLLSFECDMALAGGVTIEIPHRRGYFYKAGEILSPDGHCYAFDKRAQGTVFGSGVGCVILRRLEDAIADGDNIYAVIKGSAVNNDGSGKVGYLAPSVDGQAAAVNEALEVGHIGAETIGYVECHGTGTAMGDPIEIAALTQAFAQTTGRTGFCAIGSVKTNIGHLDTAAGAASLIKAVMAVRDGKIPPSLNYESPNPNIDFEATPFFVNRELRDWPQGDHPRRAGINSLGVGGTNAHVIIEEPPPVITSRRPTAGDPANQPATRPFHLICLSARNRTALDQTAARLAAHLRANPGLVLDDVAFTLRDGRADFEQRRVVAARDGEEAAALLESGDPQRVFSHASSRVSPGLVFLFPGGGSQYRGMGQELYHAESVFREHVDRGLNELKPLVDYDPARVFFAAAEAHEEISGLYQRPSVQLPLIFIVEYALAKLWMSRGIKPDCLIGHSMGENTAACLAGVFSFSEGLGLVALRGKLFERVPAGGMLSVSLDPEALLPLLGDDLDLATVNGPQACVASGSKESLDALATRLSELQIEFWPVAIDIAAHSRLLEPILDAFAEHLRGLKLRAPQIPLISNRTGTWLEPGQAVDPQYWVDHLRYTVKFAEGIATLARDSQRLWIEVGPGKTLGSLVRGQCDMKPGTTVLASLPHPEEKVPSDAFWVTALGRLWACGAFDYQVPKSAGRRFRVPLPAYPFQRQRYWIEPGRPAGEVERSSAIRRLYHFEDWFFRPVWRERPLVTSAAAPDTDHWLIFMDQSGLGKRLVQRLRASGRQVITVRAGDAYAQESESAYTIAPEFGRDEYYGLVRDLVKSGKIPNRIVHLWMVTRDESFRPGSSFFHRNQEHGFYSLFFLAKAISDENLMGPIHLTVLANGMQKVNGESLLYPEKATLLGPCRVIPREYPWTCKAIDLQLPDGQSHRLRRSKKYHAEFEGLVDQIMADLTAVPASAVLAYRSGRRYMEDLDRFPLATESANGVGLRENGVYLITGGLGGLGLVMADFLAHKYKAKLILLSRTAPPPREEWPALLKSGDGSKIGGKIRKIQELEAQGAEVLTVAADVTNVEKMRAVLEVARNRFGPLNGVIHAAGTLRDGLIQLKTQSLIEDVFAAKIHGTQVLDSLLAKEQLDFFALFSSSSTFIATAGQVDYVAANAFLNAFAESRSGLGKGRVVALNWGIWGQVGMAAELGLRMEADSGSARTAGQSPTAEPDQTVDHPLLDFKAATVSGMVFHSDFSPKTHWVLDEHRTTTGQALLPGTGFLEMARAAMVGFGETRNFELLDLYFFRPLAVGDEETRRVRIKLRQDQEEFDFLVQSKHISDDGREGWATHAQAKLQPFSSFSKNTLDIETMRTSCDRHLIAEPGSFLPSAQDSQMRFGPRWQLLREVHYGSGGALARLELPHNFASDFKEYLVHPAMLDLATGFAMELIEGYGADEPLWVPVSYRRVRMGAPLGGVLWSWVRRHGRDLEEQRDIALFDVVITDAQGSVLMEIDAFMIKRLARNANFSFAPAPSLSELEFDRESPRGLEGSRPLSPSEQAFQAHLRQGILPEEGTRAMELALSGPAVANLYVTSMDPHQLLRESNAMAVGVETQTARFARPELNSTFQAPKDEIERHLATIWEELLGVDHIGVLDNFFELGGHSLVAVRLFASIKQAYHVDYPISVLFEAPTIERCAALIRKAKQTESVVDGDTGVYRRRNTYLVAMHSGEGGPGTPFFLVGGMFGNVLNLRHLAHLLGKDRGFYGLQARGLYGEHDPHENFQQMAADYLAEVRVVQPHGPYLLGGFSGGGITALEMAQQLRAAGEEVKALIMLDTPLPQRAKLTFRDKLIVHASRLKRRGARYLVQWLHDRIVWEISRLRARLDPNEPELHASDFHSHQIEIAFRRALDLYQLEYYPGTITLFRPKLDKLYQTGPGRFVSSEYHFVYEDNGWSPHVDRVIVNEVPGDHDSMVLEPNVRVLAEKLREALLSDAADASG